MDLELKARSVIVTGGSRGIGRATALQYAREGAWVAITYWEREEAARDVIREINDLGGKALAVRMSLESAESIGQAVTTITDAWGRIDVLVNNAFATRIGDWRELLRANVEGTFQITTAVSERMRANRWGRIVTVSSALAVDGTEGFAWYATAKAALHGMTRSLSRDLGPAGILVNAVMPGLTSTAEHPVQISRQRLERAAARLPIRRLPMPHEVAQTIVYLGSAANSVVTGEFLRVSGGY